MRTRSLSSIAVAPWRGRRRLCWHPSHPRPRFGIGPAFTLRPRARAGAICPIAQPGAEMVPPRPPRKETGDCAHSSGAQRMLQRRRIAPAQSARAPNRGWLLHRSLYQAPVHREHAGESPGGSSCAQRSGFWLPWSGVRYGSRSEPGGARSRDAARALDHGPRDRRRRRSRRYGALRRAARVGQRRHLGVEVGRSAAAVNAIGAEPLRLDVRPAPQVLEVGNHIQCRPIASLNEGDVAGLPLARGVTGAFVGWRRRHRPNQIRWIRGRSRTVGGR